MAMRSEENLCNVLAILVLDTDGGRLAVKYSSVARKEIWPGFEKQTAFEKRVINKLPKPSGTTSSDIDVAIIDEYTVLFQSSNDVVVCAVASPSENELVILQLVEGIFASIQQVVAQMSFLNSGVAKQNVLTSLPDVLFILDEVVDDGIIMETEEEKIVARIRMIDEPEAGGDAQAEQMFQKATQSAKQKLLSSLIGSRG